MGGKARQAIIVALIALAGTLGAALIGIIPHFFAPKEPAKPSPSAQNITSSTIGGSVVGRDQNIQNVKNIYNVTVVVVQAGQNLTEESLKQITAGISTFPSANASKVDIAVEVVQALQPRPSKSGDVDDVAYKTATEFAKLGFSFSPTNSRFDITANYVAKIMIAVTKDLQYVIVAAGSQTIGRLRGYLYDEEGKEISSGFTGEGSAKMHSFRASYSGTAEFFLEASDVRAPSTLVCLVGRRGEEEADSDGGGGGAATQRRLGWEPTFNMENSSPAASPKRKRK
jgi:hypothetical protein